MIFAGKRFFYGPVSDLVPSTPVFEMYPIGYTTIAEYLERFGFSTRIINLAVRMIEEQSFRCREQHSKDGCFGVWSGPSLAATRPWFD